jgi:dethiobiotin synthetase
MSKDWPDKEEWRKRKEFSRLNASELIEKLQALVKKHGDLPVLVESPGGYIADVSDAEVYADSIIKHDVIVICGASI